MLRDLLYGTISRKIFFLFLVASVVPIIILTYLAISDLSALSIRKNTELIEHDLQEREVLAQFEINRYTTLLHMLADTEGIELYAAEESLSDEAIEHIQRDFYTALSNSPEIIQIRLIDQTGMERVRLDQTLSLVQTISEENLQDKSDRYYFEDASQVSSYDIYISPIDLNKEGDPPMIEVPYKPVIRIAVPLFGDQGDRQGIIIANINATELLAAFSENDSKLSKEFEDSLFSLIDDEGYYLLNQSSDKAWSGPTNLNTKDNFYRDSPDLTAQVQQQDSSSQQMGGFIYASQKIDLSASAKGEEILLITEVPIDTITGDSSEETLYILYTAILIITLVTILAYAVSRLIGDPLKQLSKEIAIISSGNFSHKVTIKGHDEVGRLGRDFEKMAIALREYRDYLEKKVDSRTKRLETLTDNMIGRELKMIELKKEIEQLEDKLKDPKTNG